VESEKYDTLTVNELFSKLKSAEVDLGMTAKIEGPTDSHSLALIGGSKGKSVGVLDQQPTKGSTRGR
jgi:hypothetical protein